MRNRVQHRRNNMDHNQGNTFYNGPMNVVCPHCGALRFQGESLNCCQEYPFALQQLFEANTREDRNFRNKY